ncbi:MAG: polysaccharide deacetylase family protein [Parvularculaceae bacterium]
MTSTAAPGPLSRAMGAFAGRMGPVVLMYHSVEQGAGRPDWPWAVSLEEFRNQISYLVSEGWTFLRLDGLNPDAPAQAKQVVITFDDAYADTLQAAEILAGAGLSASWFVVSSAMGGYTTWKDDPALQRETLRPDALRDLAADGMEIGGHSRSHKRLAEIGAAECADEITLCKKEIENALGKEITSFAYPYGNYSAAVAQEVERGDFHRACTTENGPAFFDADPFLIRRLAVTAECTLSEFARKLFLLNDHPGLRGFVRSARRTFKGPRAAA